MRFATNRTPGGGGYRRRGGPRPGGLQAARRAFGGIEQSKEACRDGRRVNLIEHTRQDLRVGVRQFTRAPIATATMVGIFALGIGVSAALFLFVQSFVNGPVPGIPRQDGLVRIRGIDQSQPGRAIGREFSYPEYRDYAAQRRLFRDVAAWTSSDIAFDVGTSEPDAHGGAATYVTGPTFRSWVFDRPSASASPSPRTMATRRRRSLP